MTGDRREQGGGMSGMAGMGMGGGLKKRSIQEGAEQMALFQTFFSPSA